MAKRSIIALRILILFFNCLSNIYGQVGSTEIKGKYLGQEPPHLIPKLFAHDIFSEYITIHGVPVFSNNGDEIYWSAVPKGSDQVKIFSMNMEKDIWSKPFIIEFSKDYQYDVPYLSHDDSRLFFISDQPLFSHSELKENIWFSEKRDNNWSKPQSLGKNPNKIPLHWQFTLAEDGTLYFASEGNGDIYSSKYYNKTYLEATILGEAINTSATELCPYISPNQKYLIFTRSQSKNGFGGGDLFISFRNNNGSWSMAINMGEKVNTRSDELCPMVSPDSNYLFFLSNRDGFHGVYWISTKLIETLKSESFN